MDKLTYLAKTLSRTNRKDYENFVINAIWNKLDRDDIQPVSQQYVRNHEKGRRFIDLYFPQLNIGIECDEAHHLNQEEADKEREAELVDILSAVNTQDQTYEAKHIRICGEDKAPDYVLAMQDIDEAVSTLKNRIAELESRDELQPWNPSRTVKELLEGKEEIFVSDGIVFRTITDASNLLFDTDYSFQQHAFFVPYGAFENEYSEERIVWFPKISIDGSNTNGWKNLLKEDGSELYERNVDGRKLPKEESMQRVIIPYVYDPVFRTFGYRFIGVFEMDPSKTEERGGEVYRVWRRIDDSIKILGDTPIAMRRLKGEADSSN